jgi:hypothetical protein
MSDVPRRDVRLLERLEAHLESDELLGLDLGDGHAVVDFLARLSMGDVEALLGDAFSASDRKRILAIIEHHKGGLDERELPPEEARARAEALAAMRGRVRRRGRRKEW